MRPSIAYLFKIDPKTLKDLPHHEALKTIIYAGKQEEIRVADELSRLYTQGGDYQDISQLNQRLKYLQKAILTRTADLEEILSDT